MNLIETEFGWEREDGSVVAYKEKYAFMNIGRHPNYRTPVFKEFVFSMDGKK